MPRGCRESHRRRRGDQLGDPIASDSNGNAVTATGTAVVLAAAMGVTGAAAGAVAEIAWY